MRQAFIWTNGGLTYWRIYASLGLNKSTQVNRRIILFNTYFMYCKIFSGIIFEQYGTTKDLGQDVVSDSELVLQDDDVCNYLLLYITYRIFTYMTHNE